MVPSSRELIESIRFGLTNQVAPTVTDKAALSVLRSVDTLLAHLAVRVVTERSRLVLDNADMRSLLGLPAATDEDGPALEELAARNDELTVLVDNELARVLAARDTARLAEIDAFLARRLERETPEILPAFAGRAY